MHTLGQKCITLVISDLRLRKQISWTWIKREKWPSDFNLIHVLVSIYWDGLSTSCWYPLNLKLKYTTMAVFILLLDFRPYYGQDNYKTVKNQKAVKHIMHIILVIMQLCSTGHYGSIPCCKYTLWNETNFAKQANNACMHHIPFKNADTLETLT